MLIKITDSDTFGPFHLAIIRLKLSCDYIHKSGLAFSVCTDESNVLSLQQSEGNIVEYRTVAKSMA